MAVNKLGSNKEHFKFENEGDTLIAYYLGSREVETRKGPATAFDFQREDGSVVGILGSAGLRNLMEGAVPGQKTTIVRGKMVTTKSGNDFVQYSGHQDDEDTIQLPGSPESKKLA